MARAFARFQHVLDLLQEIIEVCNGVYFAQAVWVGRLVLVDEFLIACLLANMLVDDDLYHLTDSLRVSVAWSRLAVGHVQVC